MSDQSRIVTRCMKIRTEHKLHTFGLAILNRSCLIRVLSVVIWIILCSCLCFIISFMGVYFQYLLMDYVGGRSVNTLYCQAQPQFNLIQSLFKLVEISKKIHWFSLKIWIKLSVISYLFTFYLWELTFYRTNENNENI